MERIAKETYDGTLKEGELNDAHILKTYNELHGAAKKGFGKDWTKTQDNGMPTPEVLKMQQNIYRFSGAKDATMLQNINDKLTENGKMKGWNSFKNEVLSLNKTYNINYLQAEWQTSKQAGYMANLWQEYESNSDLYPNLEYRTQGDSKVRPEHQSLNGIIKPINDPFWDKYFPPNGWRCFEPGTPVLTKEGWKPIEKIRRGEYLIGGSGNERFVGDTIPSDFSGNLVTLFAEGKSLSCTPNHRFLTANGWRTAFNIERGDILIQPGKVGFMYKIMNAIHNIKILTQYGLMSFKRKG